MRRLAATLLVIFGVIGVLAGLLLLGQGTFAPGAGLLVLGIGAGIAGWWMDRNRGQSVLAQLPTPPGDYRMAVKRSAIIGIACLGAVLLWMMAGVALDSMHAPRPFGWSLLLALAPLPFALRMLRIDTALRVDARGIEHYRHGRIPWSDVEGIRIRAITVKGQTKHFFELRVRDPERYMERAGWMQRLGLRRLKTISMPLQMLDGDPLFLFEAAIRYRSAVQPPAITGWQGDSKRSAAVSQAILAGMRTSPGSPTESPERAAYRRLLALSMAMGGGWTSLDSRDMADQRLEAQRLRARLDVDEASQLDQALQQLLQSDRSPDATAFETLQRRIRTQSAQTTDGQRLSKLEAGLMETTGKRRQRQQVWTWVSVGGFTAIYLWAKLHR